MPVGKPGKVVAAAILIASVLLLAWQAWRIHERPGATATGIDRTAVAPVTTVPGTRPANGTRDSEPARGWVGEPVASADVRCQQDRREQYRMARDRIDASASPDDALTRALLTRLLTLTDENSVAVLREVAAAQRRWPENVELAWLSFDTCHDGADCDRQAALAHLQGVDGDNLFAWLPSMAAARDDGDADAFMAALHRAANAPVYDSRMGTAFLRMRPLLGALPLPGSCAPPPEIAALADEFGAPAYETVLADLEATTFDFAMTIPGMQGVSGCRGSDFALPETAKRDCHRLLTRMAQGATLLERSVALPQLIESAPDDSSRALWREQYRRLRWLHTLGPEAHLIDGFGWRIWAEGEIAVLENHALRTGRWPPPDDWLPDDERSRELLIGDP